MNSIDAVAILDIGKSNKKLLIWNDTYQLLHESIYHLPEIQDEDGFPAEDIRELGHWCQEQIRWALQQSAWTIRAINFSAYGASLVYLDPAGEVIAPLYNYLKPLAPETKHSFFSTYGPEADLCLETHSPSLGLLNSGLQVYRLKKEKPELFAHIFTILHLPNYLHFLFTRQKVADWTSIGCHTMLWNFNQNRYHQWIEEEKLRHLFPAIQSATDGMPITKEHDLIWIGNGIHDSSAALVPYLKSFDQPFILLSTGTWCIAFNPFIEKTLSSDDLGHDCLSYLTFTGRPVRAARLFLGHEHQIETMRIARFFKADEAFYLTLDSSNGAGFLDQDLSYMDSSGLIHSGFDKKECSQFEDASQAYHVLIRDLIRIQARAIDRIYSNGITQIFVDGGFAKNVLFMKTLATVFPQHALYAANIAQASALGAALVIHEKWNSKAIPTQLISLQRIPLS
jgi:sugar (pentulose or hexulose) kinase